MTNGTNPTGLTREHVIELGFNERLAVAGCGCKATRETVNGMDRILVTSCDAALRARMEELEQRYSDDSLNKAIEINALQAELARVTGEREEARIDSEQQRQEKINWQFQYSLVPDWVRDCIAKRINVTNLHAQLTQATEREESLKDREAFLMQRLQERTNERDQLKEREAVLVADLQAMTTERDTFKKLWGIRGLALAKPCLQCGYKQAQVKANEQAIPPAPEGKGTR